MAAKRYFRKKGFWLLNAYIAHQIQPLLSFLPNIPVRKMQKIAKVEKFESCKSMIYKSKLRVSVFIFLKCLKMME
jgi:hypothetical protein